MDNFSEFRIELHRMIDAWAEAAKADLRDQVARARLRVGQRVRRNRERRKHG